MSESLIVKDGNGTIKSLQVDSGSNGYISNHTLISTVTGSNVLAYSPGTGWDWNDASSGSVVALSQNANRKGVIINNVSDTGKCYIIVGGAFPTLTSKIAPPSKYSFLLNPNGTYFGDSTTSALSHSFFVVSSSELVDSSSVTITVTEIY